MLNELSFLQVIAYGMELIGLYGHADVIVTKTVHRILSGGAGS